MTRPCVTDMVYAIKIINLICCNSELYRDNLTTIVG
jgi:hypothetical protein